MLKNEGLYNMIIIFDIVLWPTDHMFHLVSFYHKYDYFSGWLCMFIYFRVFDKCQIKLFSPALIEYKKKTQILCKYSYYYKVGHRAITFYFTHIFVSFRRDHTRTKQCNASTLIGSQAIATQRHFGIA